MPEGNRTADGAADAGAVLELIEDIRAYLLDLKHVGIDSFAVESRPGRTGDRGERVPARGGVSGRERKRRPRTVPRSKPVPPGSGRFGPSKLPDISELIGSDRQEEDGAARASGRPDAGNLPGRDRERMPTLAVLAQRMAACQSCPRAATRARVVPGTGKPGVSLMFVGGAPSAADEAAGRPFQGPAGQIFDRMLEGVLHLERSQVYVTNVVKCRRGGGASVTREEAGACAGFLEWEIALVRPRIVVVMGQMAVRHVLKTDADIDTLRGKSFPAGSGAGYQVRVTRHPAELLGEATEELVKMKRKVNADLKLLLLALKQLEGGAEGEPPESGAK